MKNLFDLWAASFYDKTTWPPDWNMEWGPPVELWELERDGSYRLYVTRQHIVSRVNENMHGPTPIYHVWNVDEDKRLYCGPYAMEAYTAYHTAVERKHHEDT